MGRLPGMSPSSHPSDGQLDAATWCRHLVPDGSVYAFLADHRHQLFPPGLVADLVVQGRSHRSVPAEVVATVMVLQALEGLSDREAVSALRRDIAWKVACGLRLDDEGFHPTVLVYWRARLRASEQPRRILEAVRQVVEQTGVLAGRGRRVLDSTILEDAVATQDTVTQLVAAVRRVRRLVPGHAGSSFPRTTMSGRASPTVPGMIRRPPGRWCRGWSTTRWWCSRRSARWDWMTSRPRRWRCWRWWRAKTSSRASGPAPGGRPQGGQGSDHLHRRPGGPPCPQDQRPAARWLQGPPRCRTRDRAGDRVRADGRQRP